MDRRLNTIEYSSSFERSLEKYIKRLDRRDQSLILKRLQIFTEDPFDNRLKTYKLHGPMSDRYAFSINKSDRIIFRFVASGHVLLLDVDNHDVYR